MIILFLIAMAEQGVLRVGEVLSVIPGEHNEQYMGFPQKALVHGETLAFIDSLSKKVVTFGVKSHRLHFFAGAGEGPGHIKDIIMNFFMDDDELTIIHANGSRTERYRLDGTLIISQVNQGLPRALLYKDAQRYLYKQGNDIILSHSAANREASAEGFDFKDYGFLIDVITHNEVLFITSAQSRNNRIGYMVFDMDEVAVIDRNTIDKYLISEKKDLPRLPPGGSYDNYFAPNYTTIYAHPRLGILFNEACFTKHLSRDRSNINIMYAYAPKSQKLARYKIYSKGVSCDFLYPMTKDRWLIFDAEEDNFVFVRMDLIEGTAP